MNIFSKDMRIPTYIKYLLSYLIIFTVLILGFFFIMRTQLTENYFNLRSKQAKAQLDSLSEQLKNDISFLLQVDSSLSSNTDINRLCYSTDKAYYYPAGVELKKYVSTANLISSIIYMPKNTRNILSTQLGVIYRDEIFYITNSVDQIIAFDPRPYFDARSGQLILLNQEEFSPFLLYFPVNNSNASYIYFYILDTSTILSQLKSLVSLEMPAIALIDSDGEFALGINTSQLEAHMDTIPLKEGIYNTDSSTTICVHTGIPSDFSVISMLSNDLLLSQINASFASTYLMLLALSVAVFLIILLVMRITYVPLHRLIQTVVPDYDTRQNYLHQLSRAFSEVEEQNQALEAKLEKYRVSIQKSLLDSILTSQSSAVSTVLPNIDQFFDTDSSDKKIFIIKIAGISKDFSQENVLSYFNNALPGTDSCILLESQQDSAVFLVNFDGNKPDKNQTLKELCVELYEARGYLAAISNASDSPLDIPSLYENAISAGSCWPQTPVAEYEALPPVQTSYSYPHGQLSLLSDLLKENNFSASRVLIEDLFIKLDSYSSLGNTMPAFFVSCILIDMLTIIANSMSLSHIDFYTYSDMYFEILYLCRSFSYTEKAQEIKLHAQNLLDFYEEELTNKLLNTAPIKQLMEENYCQPDFSIAVIAEKYHVSVSRMSVLFKKELNVGFAEYLWLLRMNKAKELLLNTDLSIDEISVTVGYTNTSSFRRKFKLEVGVTPSQFRTEQESRCIHD